ncbi:hypothetical protein SAMN04488128_103694 [Chitinophaga eiseniae]|uniref:Uncharacterized protein n=1 Tax=Chitinophaga eiseniae TaxID=634771 RepID=A0A1T4SXG5_9BACT|nr:hypothetical protein [Chitinophaga eiseniae]SKA32611.1 hypothetical protein SAMN04488128_103694 [Chitinophaga eiseniae]
MIFAIILLVILALTLYWQQAKSRKIRKFRSEYDNALKGNDRTKARAAGCRYYAALRGYKDLTALDELQIDKDVAKMK